MTTDSLAKAIRATKGLTSQELQELRAHITVLLQLGPGSADRAVAFSDAPEELVMIAEHGREKGGRPIPTTDLMAARQYDTFTRKLPRLREFLSQVGSKTAQRALFKVGLVLMERDMRARKMAPSYMSFMNEIHRMRPLINREFPGYEANGLLKLIFRGEDNVRKKPSKRVVQRERGASARQRGVLHDPR
jgi:hypothetical protein